MKKKKIKNKGILFWITGLPGSGKTAIAKSIKKKIISKYGPTLLFSGDDMRKIFKLNKYSLHERFKNGIKFTNFCKFVTNQNINIIFATVGLFDKLRNYNTKNIRNYVEIYIKADLKKIIKTGKKKLYKKHKSNLYGKDIKAELPKKPDIVIINNFSKNITNLSNELLLKLYKKI